MSASAPDDTLEKIAAFFAEQQDIRLALLFGSMAQGLAEYASDADIAVLGYRAFDAARCMTLISELANLSGRPIDLVDLSTAGVPIARSAVLDGKVIFSRDATAYPSQITRILIDSADFLPYHNRLLKERRDAWIR